MDTVSLDSHIEILNGKARIAGHRISIQDVVIWHERMGKSTDEIATEYDLSLGDIHAALAYYFDNRVEVDRQIEEDTIFANNLKKKIPSKLKQKLREQSEQ